MIRPYERAFYRIPYPYIEGPRLIVGNQMCRVVDCSERGLRYLTDETSIPRRGDRLRGRLRFPRGEEVRVEGVVVRVRELEVAVRLAPPGIPFRVILREQIFLRRVRGGVRSEG